MIKIFKKKILSLALKCLMDDWKEITKLGYDDELTTYLFRESEDVVTVLKAAQTSQLLHHYEADGKEKDYSKGAVIMLKLMLDAHRMAWKLNDEIEDENKRLSAWRKFRENNRVN